MSGSANKGAPSRLEPWDKLWLTPLEAIQLIISGGTEDGARLAGELPRLIKEARGAHQVARLIDMEGLLGKFPFGSAERFVTAKKTIIDACKAGLISGLLPDSGERSVTHEFNSREIDFEKDCLGAERVTLSRVDVLKSCRSLHPEAAPPQARRGAAPCIDWQMFAAEVFRLMGENGPFSHDDPHWNVQQSWRRRCEISS